MTIAQKVPFELVALDGPASGFSDSFETAAALAAAIDAIPGLDRSRLLIFGGWESASRGAGSTMQMVGERLGITEQFQGVDQIYRREDGSFEVLERVEGGRHQRSGLRRASGSAWLGHGPFAGTAQQPAGRHVEYARHYARSATRQAVADRRTPGWLRLCEPAETAAETRMVKDMPADEIAREIVAWMGEE